MKLFEALWGNRDIKEISPQDAYQNLQRNKEIVLLDVREKEEFALSHIKHAKNLSVNRLKQEIEQVVPHKDTTLYVYCLSGGRSARACSLLTQMGYTDVYNLGGIASWPYEIEKGNK
ncbi:sulfurtransferase [Sporanaerobium hydrogeniformans]|uniref:Sulfurtransferase n=1 Tax=Sporanaerobium hydrogeniformans TaxID=3072179 RepID=A0AC61DB92_9FIRM|nr:rhodanese-like domain-containing protein [Sporanaerobium hydrogeniformans]PHV70544.1 sulfurtransferase [Sporanaerobium hydrogeniformans]